MTTIDTLMCARSKHVIARLVYDDGLKVEAQEVVDGQRRWVSYRSSDFPSDLAAPSAAVECACKSTYLVDLTPAFQSKRFDRNLLKDDRLH